MRAYRLISLAGVLAAGLALSACDASTPSQMTTEKIRLKDQMVATTLDAAQIDAGRLNAIADDFARKATQDRMALTVSYLAGDAGRERAARKQGHAYKKAFAERGITNISVTTAAVADRQHAGKAVVAYQALTALPPKDCSEITGAQGADTLAVVGQYPFGCSTKTAVSRMVADSSDLLGKGGTQDGDSRRSGAVVETHKSGKPNQPLKGFQASQMGSGG